MHVCARHCHPRQKANKHQGGPSSHFRCNPLLTCRRSLIMLMATTPFAQPMPPRWYDCHKKVEGVHVSHSAVEKNADEEHDRSPSARGNTFKTAMVKMAPACNYSHSQVSTKQMIAWPDLDLFFHLEVVDHHGRHGRSGTVDGAGGDQDVLDICREGRAINASNLAHSCWFAQGDEKKGRHMRR
eukprot:1136484-Pelagomonas_calceolata.AAC.4